jgi:PilZ domain
MLERRRASRYAADTQAQLTMLDGPVGTSAESVTIRNISAGGLQVVTAAPLHQGDRVQLQAEEVELDGRVQYCCKWQRGYVVGMVIDDIRFQGAQLASADLIEYWAALQEC